MQLTAVIPPEVLAPALRWVPLVYAVVVSMLAAGVTVLLALAPGLSELGRLGPHAHWTARARVSWPLRVTLRMTVFFTTLLFAATTALLVGPLSAAPPWLVGVAVALAVAGVFIGAMGWSSVALLGRPRSGFAQMLDLAVLFVAAASHLSLLAFVPLTFVAWPWGAVGAGGAVVVITLVATFGLPLKGLRVFGKASPADERLVSIVASTVGGQGVSANDVWVLHTDMANAFAFPPSGLLVFTSSAVEHLNEAELKAVASHEVGHLCESRTAVGLRVLVSILTALGSLFGLGLLVNGQFFRGLVLIAGVLLLGLLFRGVQRRLEREADAHAQTHTDGSTYALALAKLYELNGAPAVIRGGTHPSLYDRLLAAGVTPDYPRPLPPARSIWRVVVPAVGTVGLALLMQVPKVFPSSTPWWWVSGSSANQLFDIGMNHVDRNELEAAEPYLTAAAALKPDDPYSAFWRADVLLRIGRCTEAVPAVQHARATIASAAGDRLYDEDATALDNDLVSTAKLCLPSDDPRLKANGIENE